MATPRKTAARPVPTADHLRSAKRPTVIRELFGVPENEAAELEAARRALERARTLDDGSETGRARVTRAQEVANAARDAVRNADGVVEFVVRSIGRDPWTKLKEQHPPTEEQIAEAAKANPDAQLEFNYETFPIPAIAASCESPKLTEDEVRELIWESPDWNEEECARLFQMAVQANQTRRVANLAF